MIKKDKVIILLSLFLATITTSCKPDNVELIETTIPTIAKDKIKSIVTEEKVETPTIDFDKILIESIEDERLSKAATISDSGDNYYDEESEKEVTTKNILDMMVDEDDRVYNGNNFVDTNGWSYGMTPCEWIYVEPGRQLISNYKPNSSKLYSANGKLKTSSGLKGCFIPIFTKSDMVTDEYEGRFYVFDDYSKMGPDEMLFNNSLATIKYKDMSVEEILSMAIDIHKSDNGLIMNSDSYYNIIYVTDLDNILNGK